MKKIRINFTIEDYFDYIGTDPCYSIKKRMLESIPDSFKKVGYNIKFKVVHNRLCPWSSFYRVHMSLRMTEEKLKGILEVIENYSRKPENVSYKIITKHF